MTAIEYQIRDGAVTSTSVAANVITSGTHDYKIGDMVIFSSIGSFTGIVAGTPYWVLTVPSTTTYTLSATMGGSTLAVGGTGSPVSKRILYYGKINMSAGSPIVDRNINFTDQPIRSAPNQPLEYVTLTASGASNAIYVNVQGYQGF